jgi:hypothetical protein
MPLRHLFTLFVSLFILVSLFLSCSPKKAPTGKVEDYTVVLRTIIRTDSGLFRGVNLGMEPGKVKLQEQNKRPQEDEENYLSYAFAFGDSLSGNYYYDFDKGVEEIGVDIYREKAKECDWLFNDLKNYYTCRYGQPKTENNILLWYISKQGKEGAQVTLQDESKDYLYGKLTITIFPFQSEVDPKEKEVQP